MGRKDSERLRRWASGAVKLRIDHGRKSRYQITRNLARIDQTSGRWPRTVFHPALESCNPMPPSALTVRFAGDAGDGVTLLAARLAAAGRIGYAVATRADPPAEIRSPPGTLAGVGAVQVRVGRAPARMPTKQADLLVALNPAAVAVYGHLLTPPGMVVANTDAFTPDAIAAAGLTGDPLAHLPGSVRAWPLTALTRAAVAGCKLSARDSGRCTHFFVLGVILAAAGLPTDEALGWVRRTLADNLPAADAAKRAIRAGAAFGADQFGAVGHLGAPDLARPPVRLWHGLDAVAAGLAAAADRAGLKLVVAGLPVLPAGGLLDEFSRPAFRRLGVVVLADADPAGVAVGAGYGGALGVAVVAGTGLTDAAGVIALAATAGVPLVIVHAPRPTRGPGLPRPADQADLLAAIHGRPGDPAAFVLAPSSPADAFPTAFTAARLALEHARPAVLVLDPILCVSSETGPVPVEAALPRVHPVARPGPGTPGRMDAGPPPAALELTADGPTGGLLVLAWGTTYGGVAEAVGELRAAGHAAAHAHLRHLHPLPANLAELCDNFGRVVVVEGNAGQLAGLVRAAGAGVAARAASVCRTDGEPFDPTELATQLLPLLPAAKGTP